MHPAIARWPVERFYGCQVKNGAVVHSLKPVRGFQVHSSSRREWSRREWNVIFLNVPDGCEKKIGNSLENEVEAEVIGRVVRRLLEENRDNLRVEDIAVIVAYSGQNPRLQYLLPSGVQVNTVDAFQGQEREVILLSTVRHNGDKKIGSLDDFRCANVSLTRAKRALVVFGHVETLQAGSMYAGWQALLLHLHQEGAILNVRMVQKPMWKVVQYEPFVLSQEWPCELPSHEQLQDKQKARREKSHPTSSVGVRAVVPKTLSTRDDFFWSVR